MRLGHFFLTLSASVFLGHLPCQAAPSSGTPLHWPLLDAPFNTQGHFVFPSMSQSLNVSKNIYQLSHVGLMEAAGQHEELGKAMVIGWDLLSLWLPLGASWMHEEWHRAVMLRRGIDSYDDIYYLRMFTESTSVSHVRDEDLIFLKANYPAEQVRLSSAGIESQYELNLELEKDAFYFDSKAWNTPLLWLNYLNNVAYLGTCSNAGADPLTDKFNQEDGPSIPKRDFTGLDCTGWVYDLFRPAEPYAQRGAHPSGVGINRYRRWSDLNDDEKSYLRLQTQLSFINFLDPNLYPFDRLSSNFNLSLRHHLTSFGYVIDANFFYKSPSANWFGILHSYFNQSRYFPGISVQLLRYPFSENLVLTARGDLWLQPVSQLFADTERQFGGLGSIKLGFPISPKVEPFVELEAKSMGWVAGSPFLDPGFTVRSGITTIF